MKRKLILNDSDLHPHLIARMQQRGVTKEEIEHVLNEGIETMDAKRGTIGKVSIFPYNNCWENKYFEEKEVSVGKVLGPDLEYRIYMTRV
ncbi:MAG: DUF4258 domain-containing protein [Candidatus Kuenenia sp.]|nr:DUF4258 domain-containing protein [Candidatus Kuenenia sp.]